MKINSGQAPSTLVPKYIGSDFDQVVTVGKNIEDVKAVAGAVEDVGVVADNLGSVTNVATNIGDVVNVSDNMGYVQDVAAGIAGLPVISYIGEEPPTQPEVGSSWYCTTDGRTYVWYKDVDSYQWVESSPQSAPLDLQDVREVAIANTDRQMKLLGYDLVKGSFEEGALLGKSTDVVLYKETGVVYKWKGVFPAQIAANSSPVGTGISNWEEVVVPVMEASVMEALRRSYAEAGYNLVDGSFEAGGTLVNANDVLLHEATGKGFTGPAGVVAAGTNPASGGFVDKSGVLLRHELSNVEERLLGVGAKIYRGSNGQYVQNGDTVPAGTTHLHVLVGGEPAIVEMFPKTSGAVSNLTGISATIGATDVDLLTLGLAQLRKDGDARGWFADPTGTVSSVSALVEMSEALKDSPLQKKASGVFLIDSAAFLKGANWDFSNAKFVFRSTGSLIFDDERDSADRELSLGSGDVNQSQLFEGQTSFLNLFNDPSILENWADSFVIIETTDVYVTRIDGATQSPQNKKVVTYLGKYGRLNYSLNFDLTTSAGLNIRLLKRPKDVHKLEMPRMDLQGSSAFSLTLVRRSLTEVNNPSYDLSNFTPSGTAERLLGFDEVFGCKLRNIATTGYGVPDGVVGLSKTKYDVSLRSVVDLTIENPNCGTSWKSIDGNNCRDIKVYGGVIDSFHGHFNCSDILVDKTTITGAALAVGIGAKDSNITYRDCQYNLRKGYLFSVRGDYGSLRGKVKIEGGVWNTDFSESSTFRLIDLTDSAIYQSGVVQPNVYELPSNIEVDGLKFIGSDDSKTLNLLYMPPNRVYSSTERLKAPKVISFKDLDLSEFEGTVDFYYTMTAFDEGDTDVPPCNISLKNIKGATVQVDLGSSSSLTTVAYDAIFEDVTISTKVPLREVNGRTGVSKVKTSRCIIEGQFDTRNFEGLELSHSDGIYKIKDASDLNAMSFGSAVVTSSKGMIYDAREYVVNVGSEPKLPGIYVHNSVDNLAIQCNVSTASAAFTPFKGAYTPVQGKQTLINEVGEPKNWGWDGSQLIKRW